MAYLYFDILGVEEGCSMTEVKRAYRNKAKLYHPDLNNSDNAQQKFIEVNEAYEFFLQNGTGGRPTEIRDGRSTHEMQDLLNRWMMKERAQARARAAQAAKKRFGEFRNSPLYKTSNTLSMAADYVLVFMGGLIIFGPGFGVYYRSVADGFISPGGLFAAVLLAVVGIVVVVFSISDIRARRKIR